MASGFGRVLAEHLIGRVLAEHLSVACSELLNALSAGVVVVVGILDRTFAREKPAVILMDSDPVLSLAVLVAVAHQVAVAAALVVLLGLRFFLNMCACLPVTIVAHGGSWKAIFANTERHV